MDNPEIDYGNKQIAPETVTDSGMSFRCGYCDSEMVRKMAQFLLPGLATACVDNTTGLFKSPVVVAVDIRKEMIDYLIQQSETFVAEIVVQEAAPDTEISDNPTDILEDFIEDFASTKRNFISRVSGWLLSEKREDNIDDFVQEMEVNGFWLLERRETICETILKNIDFKNAYHCEGKFETEEELAEHRKECKFRSMHCTNDGCDALFCAAQLDRHDAVCPYKILPCEQKCPENIVRREMDRHCITVCPMKLTNCPFYQVGCQSSLPICMISQHCLESLTSHVQSVLHIIHKAGESEAAIEQRLKNLMKLPNFSDLAEITSVRGLTSAVKQQEAKILEEESATNG